MSRSQARVLRSGNATPLALGTPAAPAPTPGASSGPPALAGKHGTARGGQAPPAGSLGVLSPAAVRGDAEPVVAPAAVSGPPWVRRRCECNGIFLEELTNLSLKLSHKTPESIHPNGVHSPDTPPGWCADVSREEADAGSPTVLVVPVGDWHPESALLQALCSPSPRVRVMAPQEARGLDGHKQALTGALGAALWAPVAAASPEGPEQRGVLPPLWPEPCLSPRFLQMMTTRQSPS